MTWNQWNAHISNTMRGGYVYRNPARKYSSTAPTTSLPANTDTLQHSSTGINILSLNTPLRGKTTAVKRILYDIAPAVIAHTQYEGEQFCCLQIPSLFITMPPSGSPKDLLFTLFREFDSTLGTDHFVQLAGKRSSYNTIVSMAEASMTNYHLGLLVIDEVRSSFNVRSRNGRKLRILLEHIGQTCRVPIVLIGCSDTMPWQSTSEFLSA